MRKSAVAASLCAMLVAGSAQAQFPTRCNPAWMAGKWHVTFEHTFIVRSFGPATIDSAGNMSGGVQVNDGLMLSWGLRSITPIKVDAACNVTGEFGVFYGGGAPLRSYAFRSKMSLDGLRVGSIAIKWPGYDAAEPKDREMWIAMERAP